MSTFLAFTDFRGLARLLERLRLDELTRLIIDLPCALLLAVFEAPFVPELAIGMVSLPCAVLLLFVVKAARPPWFSRLVEPFPPTSNLSVLEAAGRLHLAIVEKVLPLSRFLSVVELTLTRDQAVLEVQLKRTMLGVAVLIDSRDVFHWAVLLVGTSVGVARPAAKGSHVTGAGGR